MGGSKWIGQRRRRPQELVAPIGAPARRAQAWLPRHVWLSCVVVDRAGARRRSQKTGAPPSSSSKNKNTSRTCGTSRRKKRGWTSQPVASDLIDRLRGYDPRSASISIDSIPRNTNDRRRPHEKTRKDKQTSKERSRRIEGATCQNDQRHTRCQSEMCSRNEHFTERT